MPGPLHVTAQRTLLATLSARLWAGPPSHSANGSLAGETRQRRVAVTRQPTYDPGTDRYANLVRVVPPLSVTLSRSSHLLATFFLRVSYSCFRAVTRLIHLSKRGFSGTGVCRDVSHKCVRYTIASGNRILAPAAPIRSHCSIRLPGSLPSMLVAFDDP